MSAQAVRENIDYYNQYIDEEVRNGRTEQEVIDMLGDPWALAKTIAMSAGMKQKEYSSDTSDVPEKKDGYRKQSDIHFFGLDSWWKKAAVVLAVIAVIAIVMSIVFGIIRLVAPIAVPVLAVIFIARLWKNNK